MKIYKVCTCEPGGNTETSPSSRLLAVEGQVGYSFVIPVVCTYGEQVKHFYFISFYSFPEWRGNICLIAEDEKKSKTLTAGSWLTKTANHLARNYILIGFWFLMSIGDLQNRSACSILWEWATQDVLNFNPKNTRLRW